MKGNSAIKQNYNRALYIDIRHQNPTMLIYLKGIKKQTDSEEGGNRDGRYQRF